MIRILIIIFCWVAGLALPRVAHGAEASAEPELARAKELKAYLSREKTAFESRESQRRDIIENLDKLNASQNSVRQRLEAIQANHQELVMTRDNLLAEYQKQKDLEDFEKKRLVTLFKVVYRIRRDGLLRFLFLSDKSSSLASRIRVLYRSLRSHSMVTRQLEERANRLKASHARLQLAEQQLNEGVMEVKEQEEILEELLARKKQVLREINQKQRHYQRAAQEYKRISAELASLFDDFENHRPEGASGSFPKLSSLRAALVSPVESHKVLKPFGKIINEKFGTVIYHKGVELAADQSAPVKAVLAGVVEYEGWVKGLGNTLIIHHGDGVYSLSAHLHKILKTKGASVETGEMIGLVGDTGDSSQPSLYFELRDKNHAVNPLPYFQRPVS